MAKGWPKARQRSLSLETVRSLQTRQHLIQQPAGDQLLRRLDRGPWPIGEPPPQKAINMKLGLQALSLPAI
jgi:hypothetical protein